MSQRIRNILKKARYTLADPKSDRWTDARLLSILSSGQKDVARQTRLLKELVSIPLEVGISDYDLPEDTWLVTRASFADRPIDMLSYDHMDEHSCTWQLESSDKISAVIYDRRNLTRIKVYPIPNAGYIVNSYDVNPILGVTDSVDNVAANTPFGVLTALDTGSVFSPNVFGVVSDINVVTGVLRINYIKDAPDIVTQDDELVLSKLFDEALEYFVIGKAFLDDLDSGYQEKGLAFMQMYDREIGTVGTPSKEMDGTQSTQYSPNYTTAFSK